MKNKTLNGSLPKRNLIVEIIASLLLIFFVHTLISSYIQLQSLKNLLGFYTKNTTELAWIIIVVELVTITLLFFPKTRILGFILVLLCTTCALFIVFKRPSYPHDFGGIMNQLTRKQQPFFYSLLVTLTIIGLIIDVKKARKNIQESDTLNSFA